MVGKREKDTSDRDTTDSKKHRKSNPTSTTTSSTINAPKEDVYLVSICLLLVFNITSYQMFL